MRRAHAESSRRRSWSSARWCAFRTARRNAKFAPADVCLATRTARGKNTPVERSKEGEAEEEKTVFISRATAALPSGSGRAKTSRGALELPNGGEADAAQALCLRKGRMRAGGASQKCRAGACVHAHHLAHALLLYSMQGEKPEFVWASDAAAKNGCGASDSVPMFVEEEYIKHPRTGSVRGCFILGNSADLREVARLAASCSSVGMVSVMVPLLKAS